MKNKFTQKGKDWNPSTGKLVDKNDLSVEVKNEQDNGQLLTLRAAVGMITEYWEGVLDDDIVAVSFDKQSILTVLSQEDCTGLRIYFGKEKGGKTSLIIVGTTGKFSRSPGANKTVDIGASAANLSIVPEKSKRSQVYSNPKSVQDTIIMEVGGPKKKGELNKLLGDNKSKKDDFDYQLAKLIESY